MAMAATPRIRHKSASWSRFRPCTLGSALDARCPLKPIRLNDSSKAMMLEAEPSGHARPDELVKSAGPAWG